MSTIEMKWQLLDPQQQQVVKDFIDSLMIKKPPKNKKKKRPTLKWVGGLKEFKARYTALELQKKALDENKTI